MGLEQPASPRFVIHLDPRGMWAFAYGTAFPDLLINPPQGAYFIRTDLGQRYRWTGTAWTLDASGGAFTLSAVDGVPSFAATELRFDEDDGLAISDLGGGVGRLDLTDVPGDLLLDGSVTFDKLEDLADSTLLGRGDSGAGPPEEITLGSGLTMTGTTLSAAGGSSEDQDARLLAYLWSN